MEKASRLESDRPVRGLELSGFQSVFYEHAFTNQ